MLPTLARHSEKLYYFFEIAQDGSYQATGRRLGVSAPTLSYAITQLEDVVASPLFLRSSKGVTLTPAGEKLLAFCRRYYRDMEEMQSSIRHRVAERVERIRVGTFASIAIYFWPTLLKTLTENPHVALSISTGRSSEMWEALIKRDIDIALTVEPGQHPAMIKHELYHDHFAFFCSSTWSISSIAKQDLSEYPILYIPDAIDETRKTLRQHLYSYDFVFRDEFHLDSFEVTAEFIKKGYGIGILPLKVAGTHGESMRKLWIDGISDPHFGRHRFYLSYRNDLNLPQSLVMAFVAAAKQAVLHQQRGS